jgi:hypothetical protein
MCRPEVADFGPTLMKKRTGPEGNPLEAAMPHANLYGPYLEKRIQLTSIGASNCGSPSGKMGLVRLSRRFTPDIP